MRVCIQIDSNARIQPAVYHAVRTLYDPLTFALSKRTPMTRVTRLQGKFSFLLKGLPPTNVPGTWQRKCSQDVSNQE